MLRGLISAIAVIGFSVLSAVAQQCPISERTIYILVQNGTEAKNVRYELYPIRPRWVGSDFDKYMEFVRLKLNYGGAEASDIINGRRARPILSQMAEDILKAYDPKLYQPVQNIGKNGFKGKILGGKLSFATSESDPNLFILKVISDNFDPVYFAGDFFAGCNVVDRITLMKYRSWPDY